MTVTLADIAAISKAYETAKAEYAAVADQPGSIRMGSRARMDRVANTLSELALEYFKGAPLLDPTTNKE